MGDPSLLSKKEKNKKKKKNAIGLVCLSPTACKRARETALACVLCESAVVRLLMLTGSHVSVICDSDTRLEAGQRQTQLSRGGHHYETQYETVLLYTVNIPNSKTKYIFFPS